MKDVRQASPSNVPEHSLNSPQDLIHRHAFETFGNEEKALHWLHRPNQLLGGKTPLEMLESDPDVVEQELVRIDHGIFV